VHHADGGLVVGVLQVGVEQAQVVHQEHALVDDGAAGQAGHIGAVAGLLEHAAHHIQFAVKVDALAHLGGLFDEALPDGGHAVAGFLAHGVRVHGHLAPGQELQPLLAGDHLEQLHGLGAHVLVLGEEEHAHAVFPLVAKADVEFIGHLGEKFMADLQQNAHAVTGLALGVLTGAVLQPLHDAQSVVHGLVALAALDVHHSADAAGIVLKLWIVQAKGVRLLCKVLHSLSHPFDTPDCALPGAAPSAPRKTKKSAPQGQTMPLRNAFVPIALLYPALKNVQVTAAPNITAALHRFLCETPRTPAAVRGIQPKPPHPAAFCKAQDAAVLMRQCGDSCGSGVLSAWGKPVCG